MRRDFSLGIPESNRRFQTKLQVARTRLVDCLCILWMDLKWRKVVSASSLAVPHTICKQEWQSIRLYGIILCVSHRPSRAFHAAKLNQDLENI